MVMDVSTQAPADERPTAEVRRTRYSRPTRRIRRPLALLVAVGFFFGPAGAFVLGARPAAFENHALADMPSPSDGWSFFPKFTSWAVDHLPLRQNAVHAYASGSERVFGQAPSYGKADQAPPVAPVHAGGAAAPATTAAQVPQVIQGSRGWLYYGGDVTTKCHPSRSIADTLQRIDRLAALVQASGRRFVFTVPPDKSTMDPGNLPADYPGADCAAKARTAFWKALATSPPGGYLDLRGPLAAQEKKTGLIYQPTDTHWTDRGGAVFAEQLARRLDPGLLADTDVVQTGTTHLTGDLALMLGLHTADPVPAIELRRAGVTPVGRDSLDLPPLSLSAPITSRNSTTGAPLFAPHTLVLGDSFTDRSAPFLGTLFADLTEIHNEVAGQVTAEAIADSDVVVYELVERTVESGDAGLLQDASLQVIQQALADHPR